MRKYVVLFLIISMLTGLGNDVLAQDPEFSQFYANPLYLNPAYAGAVECGRLNLNYRDQWPSLTNAYVTYNVSYDQNLPGINSGMGILIMNDQQGDNALNRLNISGFYSYKLKVSNPIMINFGVKATYYQEKINWQKLTFADQINPTTGNIGNISQETPPSKTSINAVDFSAGAILSYFDKFYVGVAVDHLTQPNISFYEGTNIKLPMKITVHGGALINLNSGTLGDAQEGDWLIQPTFLYMQQENFHQLDAGIYINKYPFVVGTWIRHNFQNPDAAIVLVGITYDHLKFGYSYDFTLSRIGGSAGGAHELSLSWDFCIYKQKKRRHIRAIKSPSF